MTPEQFEERLEQAVKAMNQQAKAGMPGYSNSDEYQNTVLAQLRLACDDDAEANLSFHDSAFPDIVLNGFGVEVKYTSKPTWRGLAIASLKECATKPRVSFT